MVRKFGTELREFLMRGNVIDLAVGVGLVVRLAPSSNHWLMMSSCLRLVYCLTVWISVIYSSS